MSHVSDPVQIVIHLQVCTGEEKKAITSVPTHVQRRKRDAWLDYYDDASQLKSFIS
jgi:hypothetical protein